MTLIELLQNVVLSKKQPLSADEIAERIGYTNTSSLRKAIDPENDRYHFRLERLHLLMKATHDYRLLHHLAQMCGFVCIRFDRFAGSRAAELGNLANLFGKASKALERMYADGTLTQEEHDAIYSLLEAVAGHYKAAQRVVAGQAEFDFEG